MTDRPTTLLSTIDSPADLRDLDDAQLTQLAGGDPRLHRRHREHPRSGHLGSNLGAVEITLALHRVFRSPHDIILWDTGHQAYVHKLLTGRRDDFATLRQEGGLSGYPCRAESDHDWIENSHASTVVSYAHGLATALHLRGEDDRQIVGVLGDGALTGGMAYEGLNNLGHSGRKAIIILNDNGRSYAPTASRLGESLSRLRSSSAYRRQSARIERIIADLPARQLPGEGRRRRQGRHPRDVRAAGVLRAARRQVPGPLRRPRPQAPRGGVPRRRARSTARSSCTASPRRAGATRPPRTTRSRTCTTSASVKDGSYTAAFSEAIVTEGAARPELVAITAAMPDSTGLLPFGERFPDRLFDVGIAEQHAVTSAAGMAMGGLRPVVAVYSTFLTRAIDQVNLDVGLHGQPVVFVLDRAGITGDDGASHHGVLDMVLLSKVPDMTVFAPSNYAEVGQMLHDALELCTDGPAAIRFAKTMPPEGETTTGSGLSARRVRAGVGDLPDRRRQDARCRERRRRPPGRAGPRRHGLGSAGGQAARPRDARRCRRPPPGRHDRGRAARRRRRCGDRRLAVQARAGRRTGGAGARACRRCTWPRASPT